MIPDDLRTLHEAAENFAAMVHSNADIPRSIEIVQRVNRVMRGEKRADTWVMLASLVCALLMDMPPAERRAALAGFGYLINTMGGPT